MQNSAWKLTALAGVIGLGFLIVLQAQKGMEDGQQSQTDVAATGVPETPGDAGTREASEGDEGFLRQNQEPGITSGSTALRGTDSSAGDQAGVPDFANRPVLAENLPQESRFAPEFTDYSSSDTDDGDGTVVPVSGTDEGGNPFDSFPAAATTDNASGTPEPLELIEPVAPLESVAAEAPALLFSESQEPESGHVEPAPAVEEEPFILEPVVTGQDTELLPQESIETTKQRALELIAAATRAVEGGELETARELAVAALELPVTYSALETRPDVLLRQIDQLMKFSSLPAETAVSETPGEPQPVLQTGEDLEADPFGPVAAADASREPPALLEALPLESDVKPARETVTTEISGTQVTGVTGDATIPVNGPEPSLRPELTIEKIAPGEATLDQPMVYSINVENRGQATAAELVVEDRVPKGCQLVGTRPQAVMVGTKLIWRLGRLPAGESEKILVKVIPLSQGEIGSVATVSFVTEVAARTEIRTTPESTLQLAVDVAPQTTLGESLSLKFHIVNRGSSAAQNVKLQNIIPDGLEHSTGADLTYDVGTIEAGDSFTADLELLAVKAGTFVNLATISADGGLKSESASEIQVKAGAALTLKAIAGKPAFVGGSSVSTTRVTNGTGQPAGGFIVTTRLPAEVQFVKATASGRYDAAAHSVLWQISELDAGASIDLQVSFKTEKAGTHSLLTQLNRADRSTGVPDAHVESEIVATGIAALAIDLENVPATVLANDEFTIDARIVNRGTGPDTEVDFQLLLPRGVEFLSSRGPVRIQPQPISLTSGSGMTAVASSTIPEIGSQASVDFQITLRASESGRPKLRAQLNSDAFSEPVVTEAAVVVIEDAP